MANLNAAKTNMAVYDRITEIIQNLNSSPDSKVIKVLLSRFLEENKVFLEKVYCEDNSNNNIPPHETEIFLKNLEALKLELPNLDISKAQAQKTASVLTVIGAIILAAILASLVSAVCPGWGTVAAMAGFGGFWATGLRQKSENRIASYLYNRQQPELKKSVNDLIRDLEYKFKLLAVNLRDELINNIQSGVWQDPISFNTFAEAADFVCFPTRSGFYSIYEAAGINELIAREGQIFIDPCTREEIDSQNVFPISKDELKSHCKIQSETDNESTAVSAFPG